jgi:uncharacterized membrane protein YbhN (UPF0104 family)
MTAAGATTLMLGAAFVASSAAVPGTQPAAPCVIVLLAYMFAAGAGTTMPGPAVLGTTEAALIGVLVRLGEPAPHAVEIVMIFRLLTFWAPGVVGLLALNSLLKRSAL